jgi:8-oxo-dGTP diphosphatase
LKQVLVAAAAILNAKGELLIAKRPDDKHQGGLWEFPGGKVEAGEEILTALDRELFEELGINTLAAKPLIKVSHDYSDKSVVLDVWVVTEFSGKAEGREGQEVRWIAPSDIDSYTFPDANLPIIEAFKNYLGGQRG